MPQDPAPSRARRRRKFDLVLYGATGFVGRQTVAYVAAYCRIHAPGLRWAGNEVPVSAGEELLRIDRLVALEAEDGTLQWWVLDYKLEHTPEQLPAYRDQMRRYREAVQHAQPGAVVRCAFLTGSGAVVEVE